MTEAEARTCVERIRSHLDGARPLILELHERRGWVALGYDSWRVCVMEEFGLSQPRLYQQLVAAKIERQISTIVENGRSIPESHLRPLAALPSESRAEVWQEAVATSPNGKVTAKHVQETVDRHVSRNTTTMFSEPDEAERGRAASSRPDRRWRGPGPPG